LCAGVGCPYYFPEVELAYWTLSVNCSKKARCADIQTDK
jgi:hypothetical protein